MKEDLNNYMEEEWKDLAVEGCEDRYSISSYSRVYDKQNQKYVAQVLTGVPQYYYVNLHPTGGKRILRRVHNLMGKIFLPNPDGYKIVDHIDTNKYNNSLDNLRWTNYHGNARNLVNQRLIFGEVLVDWCNKNNISIHILQNIKDSFELESFEKAYEMYSDKSYLIPYHEDENTSYTKEQFLEECNLSAKELKVLRSKGISKEDILKGYRYSLPDRSTFGIECEGTWYPSSEYIGVCYNLCTDTLRNRLSEGFTVKQSIEYIKSYGKYEYKGEMYSLQELSEISNIRLETLKDRIYNKKWSVEKAVDTPKLKSKYFLFNGKRVTKKTIFEHFDIKPKTANSMHVRDKYKHMSLCEFLETKYQIDLSNYSITPL